MIVIGIAREERFSPNSVEKDRAIMVAVMAQMQGRTLSEEDVKRHGTMLSEADMKKGGIILSEADILAAAAEAERHGEEYHLPDADLYLSMARGERLLALLREKEAQGRVVMNPTEGVEACRRSRVEALMRRHHLPLPPQESGEGYWLKRGDGAAQEAADVVFCEDRQALAVAEQAFRERGIADMVVQAHVRGDLVKFYGVEPAGFFRYFYPGDDGDSKFGDEERNGKPRHYFFQRQQLQATAELLSRLAKVPVYGGDAIVKADGDFVLIDFNDWPSFSRCKDEAARAIAFAAKRRKSE